MQIHHATVHIVLAHLWLLQRSRKRPDCFFWTNQQNPKGPFCRHILNVLLKAVISVEFQLKLFKNLLVKGIIYRGLKIWWALAKPSSF